VLRSLTGGDEQAACKEEGSKHKKPKEGASPDLKPQANCIVEARDLRISQLIYRQACLIIPCNFKSTHFNPYRLMGWTISHLLQFD